jgi:hypothetical protein
MLFGDEVRNPREKAKVRNAHEKARRLLKSLVMERKIYQKDGSRGGINGGEPARFYAMSPHEGSGDDA